MTIADILAAKGASVLTVLPTQTIGHVSRELQKARVGVMVVSTDGKSIDGIISERDIAYSLAERRGELHLLPVSALMTRKVITCAPADTVASAAGLMSAHRIRHLPVVHEGKLTGIVSMGDVLEFRINEVERKTSLVGKLVTKKFE